MFEPLSHTDASPFRIKWLLQGAAWEICRGQGSDRPWRAGKIWTYCGHYRKALQGEGRKVAGVWVVSHTLELGLEEEPGLGGHQEEGIYNASSGGMGEALLNWPILPHSLHCWSFWEPLLKIPTKHCCTPPCHMARTAGGVSSLGLRPAWAGAFLSRREVLKGGGEFWVAKRSELGRVQLEKQGLRTLMARDTFCYEMLPHVVVCSLLHKGAKWKWGSV